jgi:arabinogalactan endo-1,4-beta-galactosidase
LPLPVVMQTGFDGDYPETIYQKSLLQGQNFGSRYGAFLSVIEVNNEGDNKIRLRDGAGGRTGAYDEARSQRLMAEIKGFIEGVRKVVPAIKITLSVSFTHYYYLQLLQDNNIQYDIIGCHWYSNMGDVTNVKQSNVLVYLSRRFNKPVWITEFNRFKGTGSVDFASQNNYITQNIQKIMAQGIVKGIFIYELFDQPALEQRDPAEAHYGLMFKNPAGQYTRKDAYQGFKQLIRQ